MMSGQAHHVGNTNNNADSTYARSSETSSTTTIANTPLDDATYDDEYDEDENMNHHADGEVDDAELDKQDKMALLHHHDLASSTQQKEMEEEEENEEVILLQETETQELSVEESVLSAALSGMGNTIRIGLGRLFGSKHDDVSDEVVESIAEEVEKRLNSTLAEELRQQADAIVQINVQELQVAIDAQEEENGFIVDETERQEYLHQAMEMVKNDIDQAALELNNKMPALAMEIEKEILAEEGISN